MMPMLPFWHMFTFVSECLRRNIDVKVAELKALIVPVSLATVDGAPLGSEEVDQAKPEPADICTFLLSPEIL